MSGSPNPTHVEHLGHRIAVRLHSEHEQPATGTMDRDEGADSQLSAASKAYGCQPGAGLELNPEVGALASGGLIEEHGLGIVMLVVLMMPAGLAGEIRRGPGRRSLGSSGGLIEGAQQPA